MMSPTRALICGAVVRGRECRRSANHSTSALWICAAGMTTTKLSHACESRIASWPGLSRPSTPLGAARKTWMPATSAGRLPDRTDVGPRGYAKVRRCRLNKLVGYPACDRPPHGRPSELGCGLAAHPAVRAEREHRHVAAPDRDCLLGREGLCGAKAKARRDGACDLAQRLLAALDVHECARWCLRDGQCVERRHIRDMHVRPAVESPPDVPSDAGCPGLAHERRNLDALCRRAQRIAVDHGVAEHHRADAGGITHKPVYRDPGGLLRDRFDGCRLVKDATGRLAHGEIGHDAAAAAME